MLPVLRRGAHGVEVEWLQKRLAALGFPPGHVDGRFGLGTEAALLGYQRAQELLPDGIVGSATWSALGHADAALATDLTDQIDAAFVGELFPFTPQAPIRRHLPVVLEGLRAAGLTDKPMLLMALATIRAESEGFAPVAEAPSRFNSSPHGHPFDLYDHRRDLGNEGAPDGERFHGRGFVQLTGRANYRHYGHMLGIGDALCRRPDRALEPALASRLLAAFLAERRRPIKEALLEGDLARARRLVNGGRHGLDRFADAYRTGAALLADEVWGTSAPTGQPARSISAARAVTAAMSG